MGVAFACVTRTAKSGATVSYASGIDLSGEIHYDWPLEGAIEVRMRANCLPQPCHNALALRGAGASCVRPVSPATLCIMGADALTLSLCACGPSHAVTAHPSPTPGMC